MFRLTGKTLIKKKFKKRRIFEQENHLPVPRQMLATNTMKKTNCSLDWKREGDMSLQTKDVTGNNDQLGIAIYDMR